MITVVDNWNRQKQDKMDKNDAEVVPIEDDALSLCQQHVSIVGMQPVIDSN